MVTAIGVPEELGSKNRDALTPMMNQYVELCEEYDSELLLFHVGDFYKAFGEAAEVVARICELNLTTREDNSGEYQMAGLRVESSERYLEKLLDHGYRIAIAEQVEEPDTVSGVALRQVTRVITPGTLTEAELLEARQQNYVVSIGAQKSGDSDSPPEASRYALAFLDVSTGQLYLTSLESADALKDELSRIRPVEAILGPNIRERQSLRDDVFGGVDCEVTDYDESAFAETPAREKVAAYFGQLQGSTVSPAEVSACGALLAYAEYTRAGPAERLGYITELSRYDPADYLQLDDVALRGLEVFERRAEQSPEGATLIDVLDKGVSAVGSRCIREWIRRPLVSPPQIEARQDAVEELLEASMRRDSLRDMLEDVYDIERLGTKVARERADARDLRAMYHTLRVVPDIEEQLQQCGTKLLKETAEELPPLRDMCSLIDRAIKDNPAAELREGGIIKDGYDSELDEIRQSVGENESWIEGLEESERERTGIDNLRVGYNEVHGYYIEVTESNLDQVPEDYTRRQTLKQAERFYTPELQEREKEIIAAKQRARELEYDLFCEIRSELGEAAEQFRLVADHIGRVDALAAFAELAAYDGYERPEIAPAGSGIQIESGRHPVVEQTQAEFVPNDTELGREEFFAVVTGPNMSGKSTYLRQVALITLMAQAGCFVPADSARIGVVDRIFTRIGASDDITGGRSTFMVEMTEVAEILQGATDKSLVLLDEVGRGTSTADGCALAYAVSKYLHQSVKSITLFATHHYELTRFVGDFSGAKNLHFTASQDGDEVVFEYNIKPGPATGSYGIEVANQAGLPEDVISLAQTVLDGFSEDQLSPASSIDSNGAVGGSKEDGLGEVAEDSDLRELIDDYDPTTIAEVIREIEGLQVFDMTPIDASQQLNDLQDSLESC